jgi:hypothetical protein
MRLAYLSLILLCGLAACAAPGQQQASLPPAPPGGEPGNIAGMDAGRIRVAFGTPQFVRKDGQAEMWRYDGASCKAFFFLYPNGSSMSVRHVETLPHPADEAADSTCLQGLLSRARAVS